MMCVAASYPFFFLIFGSREPFNTIRATARLSNKAQFVRYTVSSIAGYRIKAVTRFDRRPKSTRILKAVRIVLLAPVSDSKPMQPVSIFPSYSS